MLISKAVHYRLSDDGETRKGIATFHVESDFEDLTNKNIIVLVTKSKAVYTDKDDLTRIKFFMGHSDSIKSNEIFVGD